MVKRAIEIPKSLSQGQYVTQEKVLAIEKSPNTLFIGIPKETAFQENRIALTPTSVATLVGNGHRVVVEAGAGERAGFTDHEYSEAGADMAYSKEEVLASQILLKVAPPNVEEVQFYHPSQAIFSPLHLPSFTEELILQLRQKRVVALAWEYIKDDFGSFPLVHIMSEMAGIGAILTAAELLNTSNKGQGILLGGISGVPPTKVVILGAGVVAEYATKAALGLGAEVRIFDNNIYKLKRIQNLVGRSVFTSAVIPNILEKELIDADVVIGAVHSKNGRTPVIVSETMVSKMKIGAVIIDVSIDQGGCFETSQLTTHDDPVFRKYGVLHYCVPNIASKIARTASIAVSNILTPILLSADGNGSIEEMLYAHEGLQNGVYAYKGALTNHHLGQRFNLKSTDISLLLTSKL